MNKSNDLANEYKVKFKETIIERIPEDFERGDDLVKAISEFLLKECFLLKNNLNERSITHKLAEYIQKYFSDYNVDCEYNRNMADIKKIELISQKNISETDAEGNTVSVYPDIIIHKRGSNDSNLIVIEVKKEANVCKKWEESSDFKKLEAFTKSDGLKYKYGIYLELNKNCPWIEIIKFFQNGACM